MSDKTKEVTKKGGARVGAGRPKGEGSQMIRVPTRLIKPIQDLIKAYRERQEEIKDLKDRGYKG